MARRHRAGGGGESVDRGAAVVANHRPTGTGPAVAGKAVDRGAAVVANANHRPTGTGPVVAGKVWIVGLW